MDPKERPLVYWDTSLFLSYLAAPESDQLAQERLTNVKELLRQAYLPNPLFVIVLSQYLRAELPSRVTDDPERRKVIDGLLLALRPGPGVRWYAVTRPIALRAQAIGTEHSQIAPPDAVHLATAIEANVARFWTYDGVTRSGARRSGKLVGFDGKIEGLRITSPDSLDLLPLFERNAAADIDAERRT